MKVVIQSKGSINLDQTKFVASGGEGSIYVIGDTAYKIYHDPSKMIPVGKINELHTLTAPNIYKPEDILLGAKGEAVGYTMKALKNTYSLCSLFPKIFRDQNGLTPDLILNLVRELQKGIAFCHSKDVILVDINENNFLVPKDFSTINFIDVDSYKTPHYPPTALMESVRDYHSQGFNELTDWFSFAVLSFQLFVGLHPYKGKHSTVKGLKDRMLGNISVFNSNVGIPAACLSFDVIPQVYRSWYKAVLEEGQRVNPPTSLSTPIIITPQVLKYVGSNVFDIKKVLSTDGNIFYSVDGLTASTKGVYFKGLKYTSDFVRSCFVTKERGYVITARIEGQSVRLRNETLKTNIVLNVHAEDIMVYDNTLYIKNLESIYKLDIMELANSVVASVKIVGAVTESSTTLHQGVAIQSLLGAKYVSVLDKGCHQVRIKELDDLRVINAKYDNKVLVVVTENKGVYDQLVFRFNDEYKYDLRVINDVDDKVTNFVCLDSGVVLHMVDDVLYLSSNKVGADKIKAIQDPAVTSNSLLLKNHGVACFATGEDLYEFTIKSQH